MSFICVTLNKNSFYINGFTLSLALKQRLWQLRNTLYIAY